MRAERQATVPRGWLVVNGTLLLAVLVSATSVIETTHQCRLQYARLQELQSLEWDLLANWRQLLLEEGTWAAHYRVEKVAREQLAMRPPGGASGLGDMKVLQR